MEFENRMNLIPSLNSEDYFAKIEEPINNLIEFDENFRTIDKIIAKIEKGSGNTLDRNANRRLPFDLNARIDVKNLKTNEIQSLSVKDLTDRNLTRLLKMYNHN